LSPIIHVDFTEGLIYISTPNAGSDSLGDR